MKKIMSTAFMFLGLFFGLFSVPLSLAISVRSETKVIDTMGKIDTLGLVAAMENLARETGCYQSVWNGFPAMIFLNLYVQASGTKCVTPYSTCPLNPPQPINYPCCCPDGTCGYVVP